MEGQCGRGEGEVVWCGAVVWLCGCVVEWLYYSKRIIIVRWADLSDFFSLIFVGKMCVFVSRPMKNCHFSSEKRLPPKTGC